MDVKKLVNSLKKNYDKKLVRTLKDMEEKFSDADEVKKILEKRNLVIYTILVKKLELDTMAALTIINPGSIGKEYYFTRGHKHKKPIPEIYVLVNGDGKLITQNKKVSVIDLKKGKENIVSGKLSHRLVNVGKKKLEVVSIYHKKAEHDYNIKFKKRLFKK